MSCRLRLRVQDVQVDLVPLCYQSDSIRLLPTHTLLGYAFISYVHLRCTWGGKEKIQNKALYHGLFHKTGDISRERPIKAAAEAHSFLLIFSETPTSTPTQQTRQPNVPPSDSSVPA